MANKPGHIFYHFLFRFLLILIIPACTCRPLYAQDTTRLTGDTARQVRDSLPSTTVEPAPATEPAFQSKPPHSPRKAAFYSAVLPGLGQAYNREYWKIPIVYAAMGISAGFFIGNFDYYKDFRDAYRIRMDGNVNTVDKYEGLYSDASLKILRDAYREYVDYSVLVFVLAYGLNIIDATVFAHLKDWNMSDDLSMRVVPKVLDNRAIGFSLQINLGKGRKHSSNRGLAVSF